MIGVGIDVVGVVIGSCIGLLAKKGIPKEWADVCMYGVGLCVIGIGVEGVMKGNNMLISILAIVLGAIIGMILKIDRRLDDFAMNIEKRFGNHSEHSIAEGFISGIIVFCVGAMTIVGALNAGLLGDEEMLIAKAGLDFVTAIIFAATLGVGILYSSVVLLVFEGAIVFLAQYLAPFLNNDVIMEMTAVGSLVIIGLGLNVLKVTDIKVINYMPAIFLPIFLVPLFNYVASIVTI